MSFLSKEVCKELEEANQRREVESGDEAANIIRSGIDAVINEAISEEVNMEMALDAVKCLEEASLPGVPGPSTRKGLKRSTGVLDDAANSDDEFSIPSAQPAAVLPTRGKNMALVRKAAKAVSPSGYSSSASSSSSADFPRPSQDNFITMIEEEFRRREEFNRQMDEKMGNITKKIRGIDDHISRVKGEKKSLRAHREAIKDQIRHLEEQVRTLDAQELTLDMKERSASERKKRYEVIVAKFNKINRQ